MQYSIHGEWIEIPKNSLIPSTYHDNGKSYLYVFNPSICQFKNELYMVYRIAEADDIRKIAICKISNSLRVVPGSVVFLSETIDDDGYQSDPRLFSINERLFVIYNNDKYRPQNMYIVEIDPLTLHAQGAARILKLDGIKRHTIEKNWMPFEYENEMYFVYSIDPFIILKADLSKKVGDIPCVKVNNCSWNTKTLGRAHGACPPLAIGSVYLSFMNIVRYLPTYNHAAWQSKPFRISLLFYRKKYFRGVYAFQKQNRFSPLKRMRCIFTPHIQKKLITPHDIRTPGHSLYISGATIDQKTGNVIVSCGINNDACVLYRLQTDIKKFLSEE